MLAKIALISKLFYKLEKVVMYSSSVHCTGYRIFDRYTLKNLIWKTFDYQKEKKKKDIDHTKIKIESLGKGLFIFGALLYFTTNTTKICFV